jgi:signal transduction histidine kinase
MAEMLSRPTATPAQAREMLKTRLYLYAAAATARTFTSPSQSPALVISHRNPRQRRRAAQSHRWECGLSGRRNRRPRKWVQTRMPFLSVLLTFVLLSVSQASAQAPLKKDILILNEVGLSHSLTNVMAREIVNGVQETSGRQVEFYSESLDLFAFPGRPSLPEMRDWLAKKYGDHKLAAVVAIGPDTIQFLVGYGENLFPGTPIVICGSAADQAGSPTLNSQFTGTWQKREPGKTLEAALSLFPNTRHVYVVGGSSAYDRVVMAATENFFSSFQTKAEVSYLADMEMTKLLEKLHHLPENSIVFYTSFFRDSVGNKFVNATKALPMVASAANAPVFGMSDTYLGHGIVGGSLMNFQEQGKVTARIVSELLDGKEARDIPIETLSSMFMFDWKELKRWHIPESRLPWGSIVLFREPSFWERTKWTWTTTFLVILVLSLLAAYLQYSRLQLESAKQAQRQLTGKLIHAEEEERRRLALELHDDFSQRLAVLSLGLENVDEATPASFPELHQQLRRLVNSAGELSTDLHTLSHRLHSSTLESLGLGTAVAAFCKEFAAQQGMRVEFTSDEIPRSVPPDTSLCVFRIVQEGVRNSKKYSGADTAKVDVRIEGDRLIATVRDKGRGFDLKKGCHNGGLGIRSMKERARLLGGEFEIHSESGKGTTLEAWVPLKLESEVGKSQGYIK